jgi:hypothetical protein
MIVSPLDGDATLGHARHAGGRLAPVGRHDARAAWSFERHDLTRDRSISGRFDLGATNAAPLAAPGVSLQRQSHRSVARKPLESQEPGGPIWPLPGTVPRRRPIAIRLSMFVFPHHAILPAGPSESTRSPRLLPFRANTAVRSAAPTGAVPAEARRRRGGVCFWCVRCQRSATAAIEAGFSNGSISPCGTADVVELADDYGAAGGRASPLCEGELFSSP